VSVFVSASVSMSVSVCLSMRLCACVCAFGGCGFAFAHLYACMQVVTMRRGSDDKFPLEQNDSFGESALNEDLERST
jgi:hypothetical protein